MSKHSGNRSTTPLALLAALLLLGAVFISPASAAVTTADSDTIFDYAEAAYSQFLSPAGAVSATADIYYYRYYPETDAYIATANDRFYYLGPALNYQIVDLGAATDWLTLSLGLLDGSVNFRAPYPAPALVAYTNDANLPVSVLAYPGQVLLHFNISAAHGGTSASSLLQRESIITVNGGTVMGKIPLTGFYLVQVQLGQEAAFIQTLRSGSYGIDVAVPNGTSGRGTTPVSIDNSCWLDNCTAADGTPVTKFVPLNVETGIVILDDFNLFQGSNHGDDVYNTAVDNSGNVSAKVQLPISADGSVPNDKIVGSIVALQQGAAIFSPGQNVLVNLSFNAGGEDSVWYSENWSDLALMIDATMKSAKDQLPAAQQDRFLLVQEIGNSGQDISSAFGSVYNSQATNSLSGNHLYVGGSDGTYATQVANLAYHDKVAWFPGTIRPGVFGSSFASPAVAALIDRVARQANLTLEEARAAVLQAMTANSGATGTQIVTAALAIATATTVSPTSQSFTAGSGNGSVTVATPSTSAWTAASNASWLTIISGSSGQGDGTVVYAVTANTGVTSRSGTITVAGQTVTVTQAGAENVTGSWYGSMNMSGAPIDGCEAQTVSFSLSLTEADNMSITGYTSNDRTISSGSRSGNAITITLDTWFGSRGPYVWAWNGSDTITGSMAYFCYSLDTGALLYEGSETFSVTR